MQVEVSKTDSYYQIRIPLKARYSNYQIRKFMDYLKIKKIAEKSAATDDDIRDLSEEVMETWWEKNQTNFVKD
jgi:hypothetical protein